MRKATRRVNIIYWVSTGLFCTFLLLTGISYFTDPKFIGIYEHLGFPQYFRIELGIAKILGVILLLIPQLPFTIKEWAYAGFGIMLISGAIAHLSSSDSPGYVMNVLFWFVVLAISYHYGRKRYAGKTKSSAA